VRQTLITLPDEIPWQVPDVAPPDSVAEAVLAGAEEQEGSYLVLMKWFPGRMSAPHTYATDRLCVVVSGRGLRPGQCGPGLPRWIRATGGRNATFDGVDPTQPPQRRL
jgi:hypothetical protein